MLHHITHAIPRSKLAECIAFYEALGFEPVPVPDGISGRAVWLESVRTQIHLMPSADGEPEPGATTPRGDGDGHVGVVIDRYEATVERLQAAGHSVDPRREHWGSPRSYVRDPAGHLVELIAWPPGGRRE